MRRLLTIVSVLFITMAAAGCGSKEPEVKLADVISAFEKEGVEVDVDEKPFYEMIGAADGVIFYMGENQVVKIYEYDSNASYKKGLEALPQMKDWPKVGNLVLETSNEDARSIFNSLAK